MRSRQHRQQRSLHRHVGTLVFFRNHRALARTRPGRRALRVAQIWVPIIRRELAETRAAMQPPVGPSWLVNAFLCIHRYEGSWTAATGNGYYGGLQMDYGFMRTYGGALLASKGTADRWTPDEQIAVAIRAHDSGRGFVPWPNTARACGLI